MAASIDIRTGSQGCDDWTSIDAKIYEKKKIMTLNIVAVAVFP